VLQPEGVLCAVSDVVLGTDAESSIFESLNIYREPAGSVESAQLDPANLVLAQTLPAGGLIIVRSVIEQELVDKLLRLFAGLLHPDKGVAKCLPTRQVSLVAYGGKDNVVKGSLWQNLTFIADRQKAEGVAEPELWELCHRVGISASLIGDEFVAGFGKKMVKPALHRVASDFSKICFVRALLQRPDVLLVIHVSDLWTTAEQQHLAVMVRAYLAGEFDLLLDGAKSAAPRTVMWSAGSDVLRNIVASDNDLVLTLRTSRIATVGPAIEVL